MDDERYLELAAGVRRALELNERTETTVSELRLMLDTLLSILQARGQLSDGHLRVLEKLRERARLSDEKTVELNDVPDKYAVVSSEVDCGNRMHLCHGRCCSFNVKLSRQDLEEGGLAWRIQEPYYLAHDKQGYCVYQVRETGFCGSYHNRPAPCRTYDCRNDLRVWLDFEKMIPAPMADGLVTIRRNVNAHG